MTTPPAKVIEVEGVKAQAAVIALTEMRGYLLGGPCDNFLLDRVDVYLDAFKVADIVRGIHHNHMEGTGGGS